MNELPVGRRVAQWRVRRNMTQQQFADRLGKSKSWVDKVERGVRRLERVSNLREIADTLRIDVEVLLATRPVRPAPVAAGVDGVRAALARYDRPDGDRPPLVEALRARVEHAEQSYRHARYPALLALLPGLLDAAREAQTARPGATEALLVSVYGLVALALVKVDQGDLAWLAADRAMTAAAGDPRLAAVATVALSQALRSRGRRLAALDAALLAVDRCDGSTAASSPRGTLLIQAALAAADRGDERLAHQSLDRAADAAGEVGADKGAAIDAARVVAEAALGDVTTAAARHQRLVADDRWRSLPPEHRAAYLLDVARVHARVGDMRRAGRTLLDAERVAHSEVHHRPAVRKLVAVVSRNADAPTELAQLAATLHVA
ncbi:helix-turn-helix domain-containing protein [Micromonospora sp. ALFpr18c]|uniref:helix-turn-helix domain-containing protein n=1 Tax=unclassified Micromonospora TaxID=2617518 RepID=UPI001CED2AA9|nr:helix-turn-helix domain-containing protein [Micromonospora sp. ALFpr18c]